jgi:DNA-binding protein HU-beta
MSIILIVFVLMGLTLKAICLINAFVQGGSRMTKTELIAKVAEETKTTKAAAAKACDAIFSVITEAIRKGEKVAVIGFGTFSMAERKARTGRNPQTGKPMKIAAKKVPKFSAGKTLKVAASGKKAPVKAKAKKVVAKPKKK